MKKAMNIVLGRRISSSLDVPSSSLRRHSIFESPRSMEEYVAPLRSDTLHLGGMRSTRSLSMWDKPQWHTKEPPVRPRHLTCSPPPYTPRHFKLVFTLKTKDQPLEKEWRKEEEIMFSIRFDFFLFVSFIYSYLQICVCEHFLLYLLSACVW
jgi:hypothetical protein